jgi:MFS family permease
MPVRALSTSLPVIGTLAAMVGGAAVVTLVTITVTDLAEGQKQTPLHTGLLLTPQVAGVAVAAYAFAKLLRTRWLPVIVAVGLLLTTGAAVVLLDPRQHGLVLAGAALLGGGAGCTVSPGLFLAGFGVESSKIGRAFALVELLRAEAAYLVGPVLLYIAQQQKPMTAGFRLVTWVIIGLVAVTLVVLAALYRASGVRPNAPDLEAWLDGDEAALHSPPTAQAAREKIAAATS